MSPKSPCAQHSPDPRPRLPALMAELERIQRRHGIRALGLALVDERGDIIVTASGESGYERGKPVTADTVFRVGSITKTFTALALVKLSRERGLRLDAPISQLTPAIAVRNSFAGGQITLRQLLEHSGGFSDLSRAEFDSSDPRLLTLTEALALDSGRRQTLWPPGQFHSYSNYGYGLAAAVTEQALGVDIEGELRRLVFAPLAMTSASLRPPAAANPAVRDHALGFKADGRTRIPYWHQVYRPFGAMNATTTDMAKFLSWLIGDGTPLLTPAQRQLWLQPTTGLAAGHGVEVGYAGGIYGAVRHGHVFLTHGGDADGFLSRYGALPAASRAYYYVINIDSPRASARIRNAIERWLVADLPAPRPRRYAPPADKVASWLPADLMGQYEVVTRRFVRGPARRITIAPGPQLEECEVPATTTRACLSVRITREQNESLLLVPAGASGQVRQPHEPVATNAFVHQDGQWYLVGELGNYRRLGAAPQQSTSGTAPAGSAE